MSDKLKVWGDPPAQENPYAQLFFTLLRVPEGAGVEPPERVVTGLKEGPLRLWCLSSLDVCPGCGAVRELYRLREVVTPTAAWCRLCRRLEVRGPDGTLLYSHSFEEESRAIMDAMAEGEPPETAGDGEEG